jgi:hypothetical protein
MSDLKSFGRRMRVAGQGVADNADRLVRRVAVAVDAAVVQGTPVDTGRARSNWQAGLNKPATGTVETLGGVRKGFAGTGGAVAQRSIDAAKAVIAQYDGDKDTEIHLTNNLPYIGRLNDGWSAQAPAGFVEAAVLAGAEQVKATKLITKDGRVIGGDLGTIG